VRRGGSGLRFIGKS